MTIDKNTYELIGHISVDAGLCWIGDPCYCVTPDARSHPAKTWKEFCEILFEKEKENIGAVQWNHSSGNPGLGVSVSTGYGDGYYPVYVKRNKDEVVTSVFIDFGGEDED